MHDEDRKKETMFGDFLFDKEQSLVAFSFVKGKRRAIHKLTGPNDLLSSSLLHSVTLMRGRGGGFCVVHLIAYSNEERTVMKIGKFTTVT